MAHASPFYKLYVTEAIPAPSSDSQVQLDEKRQDTHCGANAKIPTNAQVEKQIGLVLGFLSVDQANRVHTRMQALRDLVVSPVHFYQRGVFVQTNVAPPGGGSWVVFLSGKQSPKVGDRIKFSRGHLDPQAPCHYIPNHMIRVLRH